MPWVRGGAREVRVGDLSSVSVSGVALFAVYRRVKNKYGFFGPTDRGFFSFSILPVVPSFPFQSGSAGRSLGRSATRDFSSNWLYLCATAVRRLGKQHSNRNLLPLPTSSTHTSLLLPQMPRQAPMARDTYGDERCPPPPAKQRKQAERRRGTQGARPHFDHATAHLCPLLNAPAASNDAHDGK